MLSSQNHRMRLPWLCSPLACNSHRRSQPVSMRLVWHDAGTQSSPKVVDGMNSSGQGSPEAKPDQTAATSQQCVAELAPPVIETNVTKSGHLGSEDVPRQHKSDNQHNRSSPGAQQERATADVLSSKPARSEVATDSVRLDAAYPRMTGASAAPLRSPFCSDDSTPPTPRQRAAPPGAATAAQQAESSGRPQLSGASAQGASSHSAKQAEGHTAVADRSPPAASGASGGTSPATDAREPRYSHQEEGAARSLADSTAGPRTELPPATPASPQMPPWLLAELRSPSRRGLQVRIPLERLHTFPQCASCIRLAAHSMAAG